MKSLILSSLFVASAAMATANPPTPAPSPAPSTSNSQASSDSSSVSGAISGSNSSATVGNVAGGSSTATGGNSSSNATGGNSSATSGSSSSGSNSSASSGDSHSANSLGDISNSMSSKYLSLPQPVWTSVPTPYGCLVTESKAGAIGWNFASASGSKQYSDVVCTTIRMAEAATLHCKYETAAMLNQNAFELMYPGKDGSFFTKGSPRDYSPMECEDLKRPKLKVENHITFPVTKADPIVQPAPKACISLVEPKRKTKEKPKAICK